MIEKRVDTARGFDTALLVGSLGVLFLCLVHIYLALSAVRPGFVLDGNDWRVLFTEATCTNDPTCLRAGDHVLQLGHLTRDEFAQSRTIYTFRDLETLPHGERYPVRVLRDGEILDLSIERYDLEPDPLQTLLQWLFPLTFWLVGTTAAIFLRPRDERWLLLLLTCYATAVWGSSGFLSSTRLGYSTIFFAVAIWLFVPLFVHLHVVLPTPKLPRLRRIGLPILYGAAIVALIVDLRLNLPRQLLAAVVLLAIVTSLGLLAWRRLSARTLTDRLTTSLLVFGVGLGLCPIVFLIGVYSFVPARSTDFELFGLLAALLFLFILPIWPLSYLYALHKLGPQQVEFRANRLLGTYGFFSLYITAFMAIFVVGYEQLHRSDLRAAFCLIVSLLFVVAAPPLRERFQATVDRLIYGVRYRPQQVLSLFAAKIPAALDRARLRAVIEEEILPTLMIRSSGLFLFGESAELETIYEQDLLAKPPSADALRSLQRHSRPLTNLEIRNDEGLGAVRLIVPLVSTQGHDLGLWLFGRRDPDDFYPRRDVQLLLQLANQIAPVVENVRLVETARQEVESNRRLHAQLVHAQKMEAIGRLSAGVAHDFNNLLSVILGYSSMLLTRYRDDEDLARPMTGIKDAGQRAASLTRQLLAFSRQQVMEPRVTSLNSIVEDIDKMLGRLTGEDIEVDVELGVGLPPVKVDGSQMHQVLMNLVVNARDAMPDGGRLRIRTYDRLVTQVEDDPRQGPLPAGRYAVLAVEDEGVGIEPDVLSRIFEPYFTTKARGKGTGLGLSMVYGIVSQSRGSLRVASTPGEGTRFLVYLPAADGPASPVRLAEPSREVPRPGTESILLVEDDEAVRRVACEILRGGGYRVLAAESGAEALEIVEAERDAAPASASDNGVGKTVDHRPIDLLLTDVVMPAMKGPELAERLKRSDPGIRVLFMSGYHEEMLVRGALAAEAQTALIQKPFSPQHLLQRVRDLLDA
ncbi:MAG: ATP-binding protein [Acidobacteriota bacterium]